MNTHHHHTGADNHGQRTHAGAGTTAVDPVCGMQVDSDQTTYHAEHEGVTHHFCSARCLERFVADALCESSASAAKLDELLARNV